MTRSGVVDERLGEADTTLHAFRKLADGAAAHLIEADHFEKLFGAFRALLRVELEEVAEEVERLAGIKVFVEVGFLGQVADAFLGLHVARGVAENLDESLGGIEQAQQHFDRGGLA